MLLFDLDGTITDSNGLWLDVDIAFAKRRGLPLTKEYTDFVAHAIFPTAAAFTREYYHLSETPEEIMAEWRELAYHAYAHEVLPCPAVVDYLKQCKRKGERMAIVTASVPELCRVALERLELLDYFEFILFAQEMGLEKRNPRVFQEAAKMAGVSPSECVVFDDSPVACHSARKAGCKVVGVYDALYGDKEQQMRYECDRYIKSFEELLEA